MCGLLADDGCALSQLLHLHDIRLHYGINKDPVLLKLLCRHRLRYTGGRFIVVQQVNKICFKKRE